MKRPLTLLAFTLLFATVALPTATQADAPATQSGIEELRSRLNLTPEQQSRIAPFADERKRKMQQIREQWNTASSRRDKRALMQQARQAQEEFTRNVEPLLTADQQAEWQKIREEGRKELRQRWQERQ